MLEDTHDKYTALGHLILDEVVPGPGKTSSCGISCSWQCINTRLS